jgi:hypothetical protein
LLDICYISVVVLCFVFIVYFIVVSKGDRIAQLILERIYIPELLEVQVSRHNDTPRLDSYWQLLISSYVSVSSVSTTVQSLLVFENMIVFLSVIGWSLAFCKR